MLYLKQATAKISQKLSLKQLQNNFVFQLVFLTTIKDYLYKLTEQDHLFVIPEKVKNTVTTVTTGKKKNKKILVLDMDQTLLYTRRENQPSHCNYHTVQHEGRNMYIEERPLLREFLRAASQIFDIYVYTAGNKNYANIVLDIIDQDKLIQKRFYRDTCRKINGNYIKDLKHLKKISKVKGDMILVDDNTISVGNNYPFSIAVQEFEGNQSDRQLLTVFNSLLKFYI